MENNLPVYYYDFDYNDENSGIEFWSLVESPAIEINWVKMAEELKPIKFAKNKDKRLLYGPLLIPEQAIYRNSPELGEFYGKFKAETIELLSRKFFKSQRTLNINFEHQDNSQVDAVITESWIVGKNDKSKDLGFDLPEGTWFGVVFIENEQFWDEYVATEKVKGFSIEGWLSMETAMAKKKEETIEQLNKMIKRTIKKAKFASEVKTKDGMTIKSTADAWEVGVDAFYTDETGTDVPCTDGEYVLEDGSTLVVAAGKVTEIKPMEAAQADDAPVEEEMSTEEVFELTEDEISKLATTLQPMFDAINTKIAALEAANTAMSTQNATIVAENKALKEAMSKIPGVTVPATAKTETEVSKKDYSKMSTDEKAALLSERFNSKKK